ncbi:Uncharacterised protein [Klebsiella pneumoniae]|nr:Uncharacterised protein [Klebsiella pneumoniae]
MTGPENYVMLTWLKMVFSLLLPTEFHCFSIVLISNFFPGLLS